MPDEVLTTNLQFHPRMQEDGTLAPSPESTEAEAPSSAPPETPSAAPEVPPPSAETVDDGYYRVSKANPYDDIRRHASADPEFNRKVREWAGRQNRRDYESELVRLQAERDDYLKELRRRDISAMPAEEIEKAYRENPEFAREYTALLHPDEEDRPDPELLTEAAYYEDTRDELLSEAVDVGMADWRIQQYRDAFVYCPTHKTNDHGFYDHDNQGRFFEERYQDAGMARKASFDYFQRTLGQNVRELQKQAIAQARATPNQQAQPAASVAPASAPMNPPAFAPAASVGDANPNLQRSPDTSLRAGSGGGPTARYTDDDLRAMGVDKRIELVASLGGRIKMIEDGVLYVPGLSEKVHGQAVAPR